MISKKPFWKRALLFLKDAVISLVAGVALLYAGLFIQDKLIPKASQSLVSIELYGISAESENPPDFLAALPTEIDGMYIGSTVYPEAYIDDHPYFQNTGNTDIYGFLTIKYAAFEADQLVLYDGWEKETRQDGLFPVIVFDVSEPWVLIEETVDANQITRTYAYREEIEAGAFSTPLFSYFQISGFRAGKYPEGSSYNYDLVSDAACKVDFTVSAMPVKGYENMTDTERWEVVKGYYGY